MEGNELEIISALSLPRLVRAPPPPFLDPACQSRLLLPLSETPREPTNASPKPIPLGLSIFFLNPIHWKGYFPSPSTGCWHPLPKPNTPNLAVPGPPTTQAPTLPPSASLTSPILISSSSGAYLMNQSHPRYDHLEILRYSLRQRPRPGLTIWRAAEEGRIRTHGFTPPPPPPPPSRQNKGAETERGETPPPSKREAAAPAGQG